MMATNVALHQIVTTMANNAAQLLDQGHYSMAARELTAALSVNKRALSSVVVSSADGSKSTTSPLVARRTSCPSVSPSLLRQVCLAARVTNSKCTADDDEACSTDRTTTNFLCCNTLYVPTVYRFSDTPPWETHMALSVVILFNLALCYHLAAMNNKNDEEETKEGNSPSSSIPRREALHKACSLYTLHYRMLADEQDFDAKMMLLLASVNNLGHVKSLLGEENSANECFQWMLNTLLLLVTSRQWAQRNSDVSLEGFFRNTTHLVLTASHTACAA